LGVAFTLPVILFANEGVQQRAIQFLKVLLIAKFCFPFQLSFFFLLQSRINPEGYPSQLFANFLPISAASLWQPYDLYMCQLGPRKAIHKKLIPLSATHLKDFNRLFRWAMAGIFIWSGATKLIYLS